MRNRDQLAVLIPAANQSAVELNIADDGDAANLVEPNDRPWGKARAALISVASAGTAGCFATFDGTTPATDNGILLEEGYLDVWSMEMVSACKVARGESAAVRIRVEWMS